MKRYIKQVLSDEENITLMESTPLLFMHLGCLGLIWVGISPIAVFVCIALYVARVFAITAGYHRYFSHRSYETSRVFAFLLAFVGTSSAQLGPIWWTHHHRHHHKYSDTEEDVHSPSFRGFFWAHLGWLMCGKYSRPEYVGVGDLLRYPEIRWLDRFHVVPPLLLAAALFFLGHALGNAYPALHTSGWQMLVYGFFASTVLVYHATFCINSLTHIYGSRRFNTHDKSRNSLMLALITMGEGWHNNHHRCPVSTRQGFYWWEVDLTYYLLKLFSKVGVVWNLREPPMKLYEEARQIAEASRKAS